MGPEDNPADDVQPTKEEWEEYERQRTGVPAMPSEVKPVGREQALEAAKKHLAHCEKFKEADVCPIESATLMARYLLQPSPPPDAAWAKEFVDKVDDVLFDARNHWDDDVNMRETAAAKDRLTAELSAMVRAGSVTGEVRQVIVDLLSIVRIQNGNLHADINAIQDRARTILDAGQTDEPKTKSPGVREAEMVFNAAHGPILVPADFMAVVRELQKTNKSHGVIDTMKAVRKLIAMLPPETDHG